MKQISVTPEIQARINAVAGTEVPPDTIAVFECIAVTKQPIRKPGSIFDGATYEPSFFTELAAAVPPDQGVMLQVMHDTTPLPTGRVFTAKETPEGVRAQFYVGRGKYDIVPDIDNGTINQVSIGAMSRQMLCSKCRWDYMSPEASFSNFYDQTCANGHTIGVDGTHLILVGVKRWFELSLCGTGASPGALIVGRAKAQLMASTADFALLAANGRAPEATIFATNPTGETRMDPITTLTASLQSRMDENATLKAALSAKDAEMATINAALTASKADVTRLTAELAAANAFKAKAEGFDAAYTTLHANAVKAKIAMGGKAEDVAKDATVTQLNEIIETAGAHLAQLVAASGKSEGTRQNNEVTVSAIAPSAFSATRSK